MKRAPRHDYAIGAMHQPREHPLPISVARLVAIRSAAALAAERPGAYVDEEFSIFHFPCMGAVRRQFLRGKFGNLAHRVGVL
jgi:hypothetical protein